MKLMNAALDEIVLHILQSANKGESSTSEYRLTDVTATTSVVLRSEFLPTKPEVSSSIPGATRFSEQYWAWNGVHSAS
jgi:hypothetical protein